MEWFDKRLIKVGDKAAHHGTGWQVPMDSALALDQVLSGCVRVTTRVEKAVDGVLEEY